MARVSISILSRTGFVKSALAVAAALTVSLAGQEAAAAKSCKPVFGHFESQRVLNFDPGDPDACFSAVGFCTRGKLIGGLQSDFRLTIDSFIPATSDPETGQPIVTFFIGESVITAKNTGDTLVGTDTGALGLESESTARIATLLTFDGGTGAFAGATGHLIISGVADFAANVNIGDYRGEVCTGG